MQTFTCEQCGGEYESNPSQAGKYCSQECYHESRRGGDGREEFECKQCGGTFREYPSEERKYCSKECYGKSKQKRVTIECEYCGDEFTARPSDNREYCSKSCVGKDIDREHLKTDWYDDYLERKREEFKERYHNDPEFRKKVKARAKANREHPESQPCENCGTPGADRHHDDYDKPTDVRWLCRSCHVEEHKEEYGSWGAGLSE